MGLMNKSTARVIGDEVGEFLEIEADVEADDIVAGRFLRLKVRLDIRKPLMRGVTVSLGEGVEDRWCPLSYEYLPEFCDCCGFIGHTDRVCKKKKAKDEVTLFSRELRFVPPKKRGGSVGER